MLSFEAGEGPRRAPFTYNQVTSLWFVLVPRETESRAWEDVYIPVLGQRGNEEKLLKKQDCQT